MRATNDASYASLALYVSGNAVLAAAVFILLGVSKVLASFQQPILWALISSIPLREVKEAWVKYLDAELQSRSLPSFLLSTCLFPFLWLLGISSEEEAAPPEDDGHNTAPIKKPAATSGFVIGWLFRATILYSVTSRLGGSLISIVCSAAAVITCAVITNRALKHSNKRLTTGDATEKRSLIHETSSTSQPKQNPSKPEGGFFGIDHKLRNTVRSRLHGLVAATLIISVMMGTVFLSIFVAVQIIGESRTAVGKVDSIIRASREKADIGGILTFVKGYQDDALLKLQANMPDVREIVLTRVEGYLVANNLSHVVSDVRELVDRLVDSGPCKAETHNQLMLGLASSRSKVKHLRQAHEMEFDMYTLHKGYLDGNLSAWDAARRLSSVEGSKIHGAMMDDQVIECHSAMKEVENRLDELDSRLKIAEKNMDIAQVRLQRCEDRHANNPSHDDSDPGFVNEVYERIKGACQSLLHGQVSGAAREVHQMWNIVGTASGSFSSLQEAAYLVVQPLLAVGQGAFKFATTGIGSTTSFLFTSGTGLLKFGLSIVQFFFQLMLYGTLLLYLLTSDQDPLLKALNLLPVSDENRLQARNAIGQAMGSVFSSAIKLAVFHALFTWLTFVAFGVDMPCLSAVTSMIMALLPFVPIWVVSLPAALQVFLQGSGLSAVLLIFLHVAASTFVDDMVLKEMPGSVPHLTGLGIVGGMYTFSNPLQGAILGPMLLALLSVAYNLHIVFMKND